MKSKFSLIISFFLLVLIIGQIAYIETDHSNVVQETGIQKAGELERADNYILTPGNTVTQKFQFEDVLLNKLLIYFEKLDSEVTGNLNITVKDESEKVISQWSPRLENMEPELFYVVFFYEEDIFQKDVNYYVEISIEDNDQADCALKVVNRTKENKWLQELAVNEEEQKSQVAYIELDRDYNNAEKRSEQIKISLIIDAYVLLLLALVFVTENYGKKMIAAIKNSARYQTIKSNLATHYADYIIYVFVLLICIVGGIYHSIPDVVLLTVLLVSAYLYGLWFLKVFKIQNAYACCGVGLCLLGVMVCYILSFGWGSKPLYLILLVLPWILGRLEVINLTNSIRARVKSQPLFAGMAGAIFLFYLALGSRPIAASDALIKHLPISIYAAELGQWYDNILENIVAFSESTLLHYSFTTIMVEFECFKALTLFNVFLFFVIFGMILNFTKSIYEETDSWLLLVVYFSVPYIMQIVTTFTVDIFPILIVFTCIVLVQDFEYKDILGKIPLLAFLIGCAVYTKLTILSSVLVVGCVILGLFVSYIYHQRKVMRGTATLVSVLKIIPVSLVLFCIPFIYSFAKNWYMTGNPFSITAYNNIFKSPYFDVQAFARPFTNNAMGASLKCFWEISFQTSNMVEAANGAMGYLWLLIVLIPVAIILLKNRKLLVWFVTSLLGMQIAGMIVGNLRYIIATLLIIEVMLVISISAIINRIKSCENRNTVYTIVSLVIILPNILFLADDVNWGIELKPNTSVTKNDNTEILQYVPENSNVFSFNDEYKGDYNGFYYYLSWHNAYVNDKLQSGEIKLSDFLQEFDYAILKKGTKIEDKSEAFAIALCEQAIEEQLLVEEAQSEKYVLYRVVANEQSEIFASGEDICLEAEDNVMVVVDEAEQYRLIAQIEPGEEIDTYTEDTMIQEIFIEVACRDSEDNVLAYSKNSEKMYSWRSTIDTGWVEVPDNTETITVRIKNEGNQTVQIDSYQINAKKNNSAFDDLTQDYYDRKALMHGQK